MIHSQAPVFIGTAAVGRPPQPDVVWRDRPEPYELMVRAVRAAARNDVPTTRAIDRIVVPRGSWQYRDAGRLVAESLGVEAFTVSSELGVLQTSMIADAIDAVVGGEARVVAVVGAEARHRALQARIAGEEASETAQDESVAPGHTEASAELVISRVEIDHRLVDAVEQYAIMESALRFHNGQSLEQNARTVAELGAAMNAVAVDNPDAWFREPRSAEFLMTASEKNRKLASPYNKWHSTQWNIDQGAAVLVATHETANELGVPEEHRLYPLGVAGSDAVVPVTERVEMYRCPGAGIVAKAALQAAEITLADLDYLDLYSCFPVAVRLQLREMGRRTPAEGGPSPTVTGGMAFAGGPFNNYVLQSLARCGDLLREHGARSSERAVAMVTALSGMATKQGALVCSTQPAPNGHRRADMTAEVAASIERTPAVGEVANAVTGAIAGYTVRHVQNEPTEAVVVVDLADGTRAVASTDDRPTAIAMAEGEWCGRSADLLGASFSVG